MGIQYKMYTVGPINIQTPALFAAACPTNTGFDWELSCIVYTLQAYKEDNVLQQQSSPGTSYNIKTPYWQ